MADLKMILKTKSPQREKYWSNHNAMQMVAAVIVLKKLHATSRFMLVCKLLYRHPSRDGAGVINSWAD